MHEALATADILHIVCEFLEIQSVRRFRQCCKIWADVGACYAFREIVFYLHKEDLDILKSISLNENAARNVKWLTYVGDTLNPTKRTFEEYCHYYNTYVRNMDRLLAKALHNRPPPRPIQTAQLEVLYRQYEVLLAQQEEILMTGRDFQVIKEAITRFSALQQITMTTDQQFYGGKTLLSPYDGILVRPGHHLKPWGCRQLDSIFSAVAETDIRLKRLQAGTFSWKFFDKDPLALGKALARCIDLTDFELAIDTEECQEGGRETDPEQNVAHCRRIMETGQLRDFVASLTDLKTLAVYFTWHPKGGGYPAALENILMPKVRWQDLQSLSLSTIECERQDLSLVLKKHKTTLKVLTLENIRLRSTSWLVLIPQVRKIVKLEDALIYGELRGRDEETREAELFDLEHPDAAPDDLRDAISEYLREGGRCPLRKRHNSLSDWYEGHD